MRDTSIKTIRFLCSDAVDKANSGHPGLPFGAAPMAYTLFSEHMNFTPKDPKWPGRDRFILSAGHGSMLLYALLHLFQYDISMDELKRFRQFGSKTPGHPEYPEVPGVEMTTGPLGQGIATAVGFAAASEHLASLLDAEDLFSNYTYVIAGDGDLMEGMSYEAASLAGHLKLSKLIVLYDSNNITIDGRTDVAFTENVRGRFEALGWNTILVKDGNDCDEISMAIREAKRSDKPSLIEVKTVIGYGTAKADTSAVHGAPLGKELTLQAKKEAGWSEKEFYVPYGVRGHFEKLVKEKDAVYQEWMEKFRNHKNRKQIEEFLSFSMEEDVLKALLKELTGDNATRALGHKALNVLNRFMPNMIGGSADLAGSNKTDLGEGGVFSPGNYKGKIVRFGVREHAMAAFTNGLSLYGGLRAFCATFLSFSDYLKPAARLAALMGVPSVFVFTHDSIGVGEDGPTHQPIEQLLMLRSIPKFDVFRPACGKETAVSYYEAFSSDRPSAIVLTRQNVPELDIDICEAHKGGYIVRREQGELDMILMASGSELQYAVQAAEKLEGEINIRVISMLSMERFERQEEEYKKELLPDSCRKRFAIEAASPISWHRYVGLDGYIHGVDTYQCSAPASDLFEHLGFNTETIIEEIRSYYED